MTNVKTKLNIFIIWGREVKLSQYLAEALNAEPVQVYFDKFWGINLPWPVRYVLQTVTTWVVLFKKRPKIVYVQNPPSIAPLACLVYCKLFGAKLMIDSHTAAFLDPKWVKLSWLFKFVARTADLNTCHNYKNLEILKTWEIEPTMVLQFFNPSFSDLDLERPLFNKELNSKVRENRPGILMVNRFASDDDYLTVMETAKLMPEMNFFIVGNDKKAHDLPVALPGNVFLTGYLAHAEFMKLMYRAQVVLAFTKRQDTVLWSIREILALRKPFVTTDSEVMRHYFSEVALFANSDAEDIREQIKLAMTKSKEITGKMEDFIRNDKVRWQIDIDKVKNILNNK